MVSAHERDKPAALGRWTPPEGSVTWGSGWSVDPARAARGYAVASTLLGASAAVLTAVVLSRHGLWVPSGLEDAARAQRHAASAPATVGVALLVLMTLGATRRCFGFGPGTFIGAALGAGMTVAVAYVGDTASGAAWFEPGLGGFVSAVLGGVVARHEGRRYLSAFAWASLALFALDVVRERFGADGLDTETFARLIARGGLSAGAAFGTALGLSAHIDRPSR